jgi:hypothetical protein
MAEPRGGGFCLGIIGVIVLLAIIGRCGSGGGVPAPEPQSRKQTFEELKQEYPRIPANGVRIPPVRDLRNPDFDVGGHCLAEERAGRGSFEQCLEVVGRELIAIGGPDQR